MLRHDKKIITVEKKLVQLFNDHYINIAERSCGIKPEKLEFDTGSSNKTGVLSTILVQSINHLSVEIHKNRNLQSCSISIPSSSWGSKIMPKEIKIFLKSLSSNKGLGIDKMPTKLVKLATDVLAESLLIAITSSSSTSTFPSNAKIAAVVPNKKTDDKYVISNFPPVSIFNCFLKSMNVHISLLSQHVERITHNMQHALLRLREEWREHLDENMYVISPVLCGCQPHFRKLTRKRNVVKY